MVRPLEEVIKAARSLPPVQRKLLINGIDRQPLQYFQGMANSAGETDLAKFKAELIEKLKGGAIDE